MSGKFTACFLMALVVLAGPPAFAQQPSQPVMDRQSQQAVIDEAMKGLHSNYIFPDTSKKMEAHVRERFNSGAYSKLTDPGTFASAVSEDLRSVSKDKHLSFSYAPEQALEINRSKSQNDTEVKVAQERQLANAKRDNFGFRKVERLRGNIGYLDFRYFASAQQAAATAVAALNFLANSDAIIIDLRNNGGGDPTQIQFISSYFFEEPTHLNDIFSRRENLTENFWTLPWVPGNKLTHADLYILTSNYTFSGAEEFSYNMKNLKRATLIGETTGGGAHPTDLVIVQSKFVLAVPYARAINPITKTNWEGTGVKPDIEIPADQAFDKAYVMALEKLQSKATELQRKGEIDWVLTGMKAKLTKVSLTQDQLSSYAGVYQERKVMLENGQLYYQRSGPKYKMVPLSETLFELEGIDYFRIEFVMRNEKAEELIGLYENGNREPSKRTQ